MECASFTIGWICALDLELTSARAMLDVEYDLSELDFAQAKSYDDENQYVCGTIGYHNIVIACLPAGMYGNNSAARVATNLLNTFTNVRFGLMVGIGGGIPSPEDDIRLGDIAISQPRGEHGGVIQYDLVKAMPGSTFHLRSKPDKPPALLLSAVQKVKSDIDFAGSGILEILNACASKFPRLRNWFIKPNANSDLLFESECAHTDDLVCELCNKHKQIRREPRIDQSGGLDLEPFIHYGLIGSGNRVIASMEERDKLRAQWPILCFEMEAAGLMDSFPCLVIRGISDYADSYKRDNWQRYAAATAAAYAKKLLCALQPRIVQQTKKAKEVTDEAAILHLLSTNYRDEKNSIRRRIDGTGTWFLDNEIFLRWRDSGESSLLWLTAGPGFGKSVMSRALIDENHLNSFGNSFVCYFFFKDSLEGRNDATSALSALLHQLFSRSEATFIKSAYAAYRNHGNHMSNRLQSLWDILLDCAANSKGAPIICVLDALDECDSITRGALQHHLESFYHDANRNPLRRNLKFLITSRPYDDVRYHFGALLSIGSCINLDGGLYADAVAHDIALVIDHELPQMLHQIPQNTQNSVSRRLKESGSQTYLWFYLTLDIIRQRLSSFVYESDFTALLDTLPIEIGDAYEKLLCNGSHPQRARKILNIILAARSTLTLSQINTALALSEANKDTNSNLELQLLSPESIKGVVENTCGLFVQIFDSKVHFIHQTAREFLLNAQDTSRFQWGGTFDLTHAHIIVCELSLQQLVLRDMPVWHLFIDSSPVGNYSKYSLMSYFFKDIDVVDDDFFAYAGKHWKEHFFRVPPSLRNSVHELVVQLLLDKTEMYKGVQKVGSMQQRRLHAFCFAASQNMVDVCKYMLELYGKDCNASLLFEDLIHEVLIFRIHLKEEQALALFEIFFEKLLTLEDHNYLLDYALDQALSMRHTDAIQRLVSYGACIDVWSIRFALALDLDPRSAGAEMKAILGDTQASHDGTVSVSAERSDFETMEAVQAASTAVRQGTMQSSNTNMTFVLTQSKHFSGEGKIIPYMENQVYVFRDWSTTATGLGSISISSTHNSLETFYIPIRQVQAERPLFPSQLFNGLVCASANSWTKFFSSLVRPDHAKLPVYWLKLAFIQALKYVQKDSVETLFRLFPSIFDEMVTHELENFPSIAASSDWLQDNERARILLSLKRHFSERELMHVILRGSAEYFGEDLVESAFRSATAQDSEIFERVFQKTIDICSIRTTSFAETILETGYKHKFTFNKHKFLSRAQTFGGINIFTTLGVSYNEIANAFSQIFIEHRSENQHFQGLMEAMIGIGWTKSGSGNALNSYYERRLKAGQLQNAKYGFLYLAAHSGELDLLRYLLSRGCEANPTTLTEPRSSPYFFSALEASITNGHDQVAWILLEAGAKMESCQDGSSGLFSLLLRSILGLRNPELALALLDGGVDVNHKCVDAKAMWEEVANPRVHETVIAAILKRKPNYRSAEEVETAFLNRQFLGILNKLWRDPSAHAREKAMRTLGKDLFLNAIQAARKMLGRDPSFNASQTARMMLEETEHVLRLASAAEMHGFPLHESYKEAGSALCVAAYEGRTDVIDFLLTECNVVVDARGGIFGTALCAAAYAGHRSTIELLLLSGASVNLKGLSGTPLDYALKSDMELEHVDKIPELSSRRNMPGKEIVTLLRNWGAVSSEDNSPPESIGIARMGTDEFLDDDNVSVDWMLDSDMDEFGSGDEHIADHDNDNDDNDDDGDDDSDDDDDIYFDFEDRDESIGATRD